MAKISKPEIIENIDIEESISKSEEFINNNKEKIGGAILIIAILVSGYLWYTKSYLANKETEAAEQMFVAEGYFSKDSLKLALDGDGSFPGFVEISDEYSSTKSGNLANYYAGISYLKLGDFDSAIEYLEKYDGEDIMTSALAIGAIGDAYIELGDKEKAAKQYRKAANENPNEFTTPIFLMKAGQVYEARGEHNKAVEVYETIKKEYPNTQEGNKVLKYLARAKANS